MLAEGTVLQNRYRVRRLLGRGGMGAVYEAVDERFDNRVALKQAEIAEPELGRAFEREARLLRTLRHRALPVVIDYFHEGDAWYLVMDYVEGEDLSARLKSAGGALPVDEVLAWGDQVLGVLEYLHSHEPPIVHRDIKPQNLKLTPGGSVVLLDFGLSKGAALDATRSSGEKSVVGYTPHYAPLEQIHGVGTDPRSDLYSLAATLYALMTGRKPPDAGFRATVTASGAPDPLEPADALNPLVPPAVADVLDAALSPNPNARPPSAAAMRAALRDAARGPGRRAPAGDAARGAIRRARPIPPLGDGAADDDMRTRFASDADEHETRVRDGLATAPRGGPAPSRREIAIGPVRSGAPAPRYGRDAAPDAREESDTDPATRREPAAQPGRPGGPRPGRPRLGTAVAVAGVLGTGALALVLGYVLSGGPGEPVLPAPPPVETPAANANVAPEPPPEPEPKPEPKPPPRGDEPPLTLQDIRVGDGPSPRPGDRVLVHYVGRLEDGTVFDDTYESGRPFSFVLGSGDVLPGWEQGVQSMRVGGRRRIVVPASLGYGYEEFGGIPPGSTLVFDVEMVGLERSRR